MVLIVRTSVLQEEGPCRAHTQTAVEECAGKLMLLLTSWEWGLQRMKLTFQVLENLQNVSSFCYGEKLIWLMMQRVRKLSIMGLSVPAHFGWVCQESKSLITVYPDHHSCICITRSGSVLPWTNRLAFAYCKRFSKFSVVL